MIYIKTDEEIELMREANQLVGKTLGELAKHIAPGVTTLQLDRIAETFIRDHGAEPAFLGYGGFPNSICASVNENVVHGIPSDKVILKDGDIISVDCGTKLNGFVGDSAYTFCVGNVSEPVKDLLRTTKESLYKGIEQAQVGRRVCGPLLKSGMCICIEPMINQGSKNVVFEADGWTVRTKDRKCSAHFEHCIAIRPEGPLILSSFEYLEAVVGKEI